MQVAAILLTAGRSRRMRQPKAWLRLDGETLLVRAERVCAEAEVAPRIVVVGSAGPEAGLVSAADVRAALGTAPEVPIVIGKPDAGPIDSMRAGLREVPSGHAVLVWPIDHPFADAPLVRRLIAALDDVEDRIVLPVRPDRRGHPVLFGPAAAGELLLAGADAGARTVVRRRSQRVVEVEAADPRLAAILNTPEEAAAVGLELTPWPAVDGNAGV